jgi:hypothetical protein
MRSRLIERPARIAARVSCGMLTGTRIVAGPDRETRRLRSSGDRNEQNPCAGSRQRSNQHRRDH